MPAQGNGLCVNGNTYYALSFDLGTAAMNSDLIPQSPSFSLLKHDGLQKSTNQGNVINSPTCQKQHNPKIPASSFTKIVSPTSGVSTVRKTFTALSSLLLDKKYFEANQRVQNHPEEAFAWVQKGSSPARINSLQLVGPLMETNLAPDEIHRLPLHIACADLAFAAESSMRFQLEQLILRLVLVFPEACSLVDHENQIPLHYAILNNATPETISMLLMADPGSVYQKDQCGRNAAELNRHRSGVFALQVKELLSMGCDFWENVRWKASDRFATQHFSVRNPGERPSNLYPVCIGLGEEITAYDSSLTVDPESESICSKAFVKSACIGEMMDLSWQNHNNDKKADEDMEVPAGFSLPSSSTHFAQYDQRSFAFTLVSPDKHSVVSELTTGQISSAHVVELKTERETEPRARVRHSIANELNEKNARLIDMDFRPCREVEGKAPVHKMRSENAILLKSLLQKIQSKQRRAMKNPVASTPMCEVISLRLQNAALKRKVERLTVRKSKQAEKIEYLKSIIACTATEDLLLELSESESTSTFSLMDGVATGFATTAENDFDDISSTSRSVKCRLAAGAITAVNSPTASKHHNCMITGLSAFRFEDFVARLQRKVSISKEKQAGKSVDEFNPIKADSLDDICSMAAELFAAIVAEDPVAGTSLILQWEPPRFPQEHSPEGRPGN